MQCAVSAFWDLTNEKKGEIESLPTSKSTRAERIVIVSTHVDFGTQYVRLFC